MISKNYGQKKGLALHGYHLLRHTLLSTGVFDPSKIDPTRVKRLVFVCKGNICRSAFAQAYALRFATHTTSIQILSGGLRSGTQGTQSPASAQNNALKFNVDLSLHRATGLSTAGSPPDGTPPNHGSDTLLVGFEPWHCDELQKLYPKAQVTLLGAWSNERRAHIHDPYGLSAAYFEKCFSLIAQGVRNLLRHLNLAPSVLVTEANTLGAIAVIRSLSVAGYHVVGASQEPEALGFDSRHCHEQIVMGNYNSQSDNPFFSQLDSVITEKNIACIIPSEAFLMRIQPRLKNYLNLMPFSQEARVLLSGMSKYDLFDKTSRQNCPPTLLLDSSSIAWNDSSALLKALEALGTGPLFIKVDALYSTTGLPGKVFVCTDAQDAAAKISKLQSQFSKLMVQGFVPGKGVGYFANRVLGKNSEPALITEFMHERLHEVPHTGGASSLRCSTWNEAIRKDAIQRLSDMEWIGPAMVEYRVEGDQFYLMEMNGRFWGSLHLALYAGADFPGELVDHFLDKPFSAVKKQSHTKKTIYCRHTFPMDFQHTWSTLKDRNIALSVRLLKCVKFVLLGLHPRVYSDLLYPGDRKLYFTNLKRYFKLLLSRKTQ